MSQKAPDHPNESSAQDERYHFRDTKAPEWFAMRTASKEAGFLLPHLRPGMALLDCGCGPGSITLGLAEAVAPGSVVGIDIQPGQVEKAMALAAESDMVNVRFEEGNVLELAFSDASFDAAFANGVLMYLPDPLAALREMYRVLKPGGLIGVRDTYVDKGMWEPSTQLLEDFLALRRRAWVHRGWKLDYPPRQRRFLLDAGFVNPEAYADAVSAGTPESLRSFGGLNLLGFDIQMALALEQGWVDEAKIAAMRDEMRAWYERPDALQITPWCSAVGWKPE